MPGSIKRKSQRAGGCSWRDQKKSVRKLKMRGGGHGHLHKKGGNRKSMRNRSMRGGGGCGYNPQRGRGRSMRGGGCGAQHPRGRSMRKLSRKRIRNKRKGVIVDEEKFRKRR
jgi:hypothetical protein